MSIRRTRPTPRPDRTGLRKLMISQCFARRQGRPATRSCRQRNRAHPLPAVVRKVTPPRYKGHPPVHDPFASGPHPRPDAVPPHENVAGARGLRTATRRIQKPFRRHRSGRLHPLPRADRRGGASSQRPAQRERLRFEGRGVLAFFSGSRTTRRRRISVFPEPVAREHGKRAVAPVGGGDRRQPHRASETTLARTERMVGRRPTIIERLRQKRIRRVGRGEENSARREEARGGASGRPRSDIAPNPPPGIGRGLRRKRGSSPEIVLAAGPTSSGVWRPRSGSSDAPRRDRGSWFARRTLHPSAHRATRIPPVA